MSAICSDFTASLGNVPHVSAFSRPSQSLRFALVFALAERRDLSANYTVKDVSEGDALAFWPSKVFFFFFKVGLRGGRG